MGNILREFSVGNGSPYNSAKIMKKQLKKAKVVEEVLRFLDDRNKRIDRAFKRQRKRG